MTSPKLFCKPDHARSTRISHEADSSFEHTKQRTTTDLVLPQPDIRLLMPHCRLAKANVRDHLLQPGVRLQLEALLFA